MIWKSQQAGKIDASCEVALRLPELYFPAFAHFILASVIQTVRILVHSLCDTIPRTLFRRFQNKMRRVHASIRGRIHRRLEGVQVSKAVVQLRDRYKVERVLPQAKTRVNSAPIFMQMEDPHSATASFLQF